MKTRMDKYHNKKDDTPKREEKNNFLYDEIYGDKKEPTSNVTLLDNVNEIDINKIKELLNNRENYNRSREYRKILGDQPIKKDDFNYDFKEPETKDYDINELIKKKKDGVEDEEKIRKISNTQYDILKGLTLNESESDFFTQERELRTLINTISDNEDFKTLDLFRELKGTEEEELTPAVIQKQVDIKTLKNTFEFEKGDFEDLNISKKESSLTFKIVLIFIISIIIVAGVFFLILQLMGN